MNYDPAITQGMKNANKQGYVDLWSVWNKIKCKILVIRGIRSQILTKSTVKKMKETKILTFMKLNIQGHTPSLMNCEEINYIKSWLEKLEQ